MEPLKNIAKARVLTLKDQVDYQAGQIVSKTLVQNSAVSITLFAFDAGEEISTHQSDGDAFVTCLDGVGILTIDGKDFELNAGESFRFDKNGLHSVTPQGKFKMSLLLVIE